MTFKLSRQYLITIIICAFLWNQQANYLAQKIAIENSYRDKVVSQISRILEQEKFIVIVNVEFSTIGGTLKKTPTPQSGQKSSTSYTPIPGLPTLPSANGSKTGEKNLIGNNYSIGRVEVNIGLDGELATGSVKQDIISLVKKIIPETKDCEDCIKIEALQFPQSQASKRLDELENHIVELENAKREADLAADAMRLDNLTKQLEETQKRRDNLETLEARRQLQQIEEDSIRFAKLIESDKNRKKQDSIRFANTEKRLERVMESKIRSDSVIISETMDIVKQQGGNKGGSLLGMQGDNGGSGIMNSILVVFLIIALMIVTFLAANNKKPKTIYLKPKDKGNKKTKKENGSPKKNDNENMEDETTTEALVPPKEVTQTDEDAIRSELKSMRQTAVSMTVGEKENASTLIKEWLADNPNKEDSPEGEGEGDE